MQVLSAQLFNFCYGQNFEDGNFGLLAATQECQSVQTCVRKGAKPIVYGRMVCWHSNLPKYTLQASNDQTMSRTYVALSETGVTKFEVNLHLNNLSYCSFWVLFM